IVGEDVTVGRYDDARAEPMLLILALTTLAEVTAQLVERIGATAAAASATLLAEHSRNFHILHDVDAHHRWNHFLDQRRKRGDDADLLTRLRRVGRCGRQGRHLDSRHWRR